MWPNTSSNGLKPRDSWTDSLTVNNSKWMPSSQCFSVSKQYDHITFYSVWWNPSRGTLTFRMVGWRFILSLRTVMPNSCMTCWKIPDMKFEPWSDWTDFGRPTNVKNFTRALTMFLVLIFLSGMAFEKRVEAHFIVSRYSWPDLVLGKVPTQSKNILLKGLSKVSMGCKWAFGIVWLAFPIVWQVWQDLQN